MERAQYSPPWIDTDIIGIAGSSGSGKTSLALEIVSSLNLPWVVILSMASLFSFHIFPFFFKVLNLTVAQGFVLQSIDAHPACSSSPK